MSEVEIRDKQIKRLRSLLADAETNLAAARELLTSVIGDGDTITAPRDMIVSGEEGKIIEGVFDGQVMLGPDGKNYPVPTNYASKSKLVEGDIMKLTITPEGKFLYKQIGPVERKTVIGTITRHDDKYFVEVGGREYEVLYKLPPSSRQTIKMPAGPPSRLRSRLNLILKNTPHTGCFFAVNQAYRRSAGQPAKPWRGVFCYQIELC